MAAVEQHDLEGIVAKRKSDPYRRGVKWWKIKNRAYSQADDGRGELLNGDGRAVARLRKNSANLRVRFSPDRQNPE
jgi:hypothetical protein